MNWELKRAFQTLRKHHHVNKLEDGRFKIDLLDRRKLKLRKSSVRYQSSLMVIGFHMADKKQMDIEVDHDDTGNIRFITWSENDQTR